MSVHVLSKLESNNRVITIVIVAYQLNSTIVYLYFRKTYTKNTAAASFHFSATIIKHHQKKNATLNHIFSELVSSRI